jgi:hypothetical protein
MGPAFRRERRFCPSLKGVGVSAYRLVLPALLCASLIFWGQFALGQEDAPPISVGDSTVGYIDSAIPATQVRFRFDDAKGIDRANRAEFLWAWPPPSGPGPALDETNVDYQSMTAYVEYALTPGFSAFADVGGLLVNPDINPNTGGLADAQGGLKWALLQDCDSVLTLQVRGYAPSGDADRGLGVGHASIEPGLLLFQRTCEFNFEGELRYWIPIDGTPERAGSVIRYGAGISRDYWIGCQPVTPVLEVVGWTVMDGSERFLTPGGPVVEDADGDTIVNLKIGARTPVTCASDIYVGYGHSLTGERWYRDILRLEWRSFF